MIIKDFLDSVTDEVQDDDEALRERLLKGLTFIEDEVLNYTNLLTKTFVTIIPDDRIVRLPYDFKYPKNAFIGSIKIKRVDKNIADDIEGTSTSSSYSIDVTRIVPRPDVRLILKPLFFEYMNIATRRSSEMIGYGLRMINDAEDNILGEIFDNDNAYYPESLNDITLENIKIKVYDSGDDVTVYGDVSRIEDYDILEILTVFGLYRIKLMKGVTEYFIAENGFTYSDALMTTLITRGSLDGNNRIANFSSDVVATNIFTLEYSAGASRYINENQVDIMLDTFKNLIFVGMVWQAYEYLKKPNKSKEKKESFYTDLKSSILAAGRMDTFGKEKKFRQKTSRHAFRLPFMR